MKLKTFGHLILFMFGFLLYSTLSYGMVIFFFMKWFITSITFGNALGMALLSSIVNPLNTLVMGAQIKLVKNDGIDTDNENISLIWAAILFPYILLVVGLLFNFVI